MSTPSGLTFLQSITGYTQHVALQTNPSANMPIRIAVIDPSYVASSFPGTLPKVTFEGEDAVTEKRFIVIARDYFPGPGDRVVMLPVGHTYVIAGVISPTIPLDIDSPLRRLDGAKRVYMDGDASVNATSGQTETTTTIGYGATFPNGVPRVLIQHRDTAQNSYIFRIQARTTSNFTVGMRKPDNTAFGSSITTDISWFAVGNA